MSETFGLYEATINLNSRGLNQVRRTDLTAPEIAILRKVHALPNEFLGGLEPVLDIKRVGEAKRSEAEERARLGGVMIDGVIPVFAKKMFDLAFPNEHIPLPREIPGFEEHAINPASAANLLPKRKQQSAASIMED